MPRGSAPAGTARVARSPATAAPAPARSKNSRRDSPVTRSPPARDGIPDQLASVDRDADDRQVVHEVSIIEVANRANHLFGQGGRVRFGATHQGDQPVLAEFVAFAVAA